VVSRREEWLEPDGLGGFASGTTGLVRTRRYHALLLSAATPPTHRCTLVNAVEAWADTPEGSFALSTHHYFPDVDHPDGADRVASFSADPWPRWTYKLPNGVEIEHEIFVPKGYPMVAVSWKLKTAGAKVGLRVRPLFSGRDYHHLQHQNGAFRFDLVVRDGCLVFQPYEALPEIVCSTNGEYRHQPSWFLRFLYTEERNRGLDHLEDLASPGEIRFALDQDEACLLMAARSPSLPNTPLEGSALKVRNRLAEVERARRARFSTRLHRAADAYVVEGLRGKTIVAGYPWFTDWGRDTFISLRGLCLATGRFDDAQEILSTWANSVSQGMMPNRFPDKGEQPEYNSVDASLWYVIAVANYLELCADKVSSAEREAFQETVSEILDGYLAGTRYGIRVDEDGLVAAGEWGVALTWMDARVGDWAVTPRSGKPVEVQALWLNALSFASSFDPKYRAHFERGLASFQAKFWNESAQCLFDVIDVEHRKGEVDAKVRPNQIFAAGGLPISLVDEARARRVLDRVEAELYTPLGVRTLAPLEPGYIGSYRGGVRERDCCYHQGTAWPWLLGPFVEAWVRSRGATREARAEARTRFVEPLLQHLDAHGIGHIAEIADGDPPHNPGGCPFQAWSLGELLRLEELVLREPEARPVRQTTNGQPRRRTSTAR
jgi:predicted glycogen debranching enzyme